MAARRKKSDDKQRTDHPTGLQISQAAADVLKEMGPSGFHVDYVLERTGLTRGALYHHFVNVDDLIESALVLVYAEGIGRNVALLREVLASARTFEEFRDGIFAANEAYVRDADLVGVRRLRAHAMSLAGSSERFASLLAAEQQRLTDEYLSVISRAQREGWVRPDVDPHALAVFVQAYSFGVIVDDIAEAHVDRDAWRSIIEAFFRGVVFPDERR